MSAVNLEQFMLPARAKRLKDKAAERTRNLVLALDGVHDPHNLSATIRSADAFGLLDVHIIESQAHMKISHKVSQGTHKWLDIHRWPDPDKCSRSLLKDGFKLWVADVNQRSLPVDELPWGDKIAMVFGNEHHGASEQMRSKATGFFHIPMYGFAESFNISVSVGISLAIAIRGRWDQLGRHGDLPLPEQEKLISKWQQISVRGSQLILDRLKTHC
jgi:tRNA (guanosine-2'-O-)-methyltransferase